MKRIALTVERMRAYGRNVCEGVAAYAQERTEDWALEFVDSRAVGGRGGYSCCDGAIVRIVDDRMAARLRVLRRPVVDIFCRKAHKGIVGVDADHLAIAKLAGRHFLTRKFSYFAFCGYDGIRYSDERREAFVRYLRHNRYGCDCYRTPPGAMKSFDDDVIQNERVKLGADARRLMAWLRKLPKPCAVFCCHDLRAYQVIELCRQAGIAVPNEIAVLGVDDDHMLCSFTTPKISSVDPNAFGVGWAAAEALDRLMRGEAVRPKRGFVSVPPKDIIVRASTEVYPYDPKWISDALVFIRRNVVRSVNAADVFAHLGLSHTVVERTFKKALGSTIQREIMKARVEEAQHLLLTTDLSASEIGVRCGSGPASISAAISPRSRGIPRRRSGRSWARPVRNCGPWCREMRFCLTGAPSGDVML